MPMYTLYCFDCDKIFPVMIRLDHYEDYGLDKQITSVPCPECGEPLWRQFEPAMIRVH